MLLKRVAIINRKETAFQRKTNPCKVKDGVKYKGTEYYMCHIASLSVSLCDDLWGLNSSTQEHEFL